MSDQETINDELDDFQTEIEGLKNVTSKSLSYEQATMCKKFIRICKEMNSIAPQMKSFLLLFYPDIFDFFNREKEIKKMIYDNLEGDDKVYVDLVFSFHRAKLENLDTYTLKQLEVARTEFVRIETEVTQVFLGMSQLYGTEQNALYRNHVRSKTELAKEKRMSKNAEKKAKKEVEAMKKEETKVGEEKSERVLRSRGPKPVYDEEAEEVDDEEEVDVEVVRKPKKSKKFDYSKLTETMASNFNEDEIQMIDILIEYGIRKFQDLKERNVDIKTIQIRNPFVENEERVTRVLASQQVSSYDY